MAQRILLHGVTGSGKSTAALAIGARTGLPVTLVDDLMWEPGWITVPGSEQRARIAPALARGEWVLDTAYSAWRAGVVEQADLVVGLDYPRWLSFARLLRRSVRRAARREPVCNGNIETWGRLMGRDSILRWHVRSFSKKRRQLREWATAPDGPELLVFRRPRELEAWVATL